MPERGCALGLVESIAGGILSAVVVGPFVYVAGIVRELWEIRRQEALIRQFLEWAATAFRADLRAGPPVLQDAKDSAWISWWLWFLDFVRTPERWPSTLRAVSRMALRMGGSLTDWADCARIWLLLDLYVWTPQTAAQGIIPWFRAALEQELAWRAPVPHPIWVVLGRIRHLPDVAAVVPWEAVAAFAEQGLRLNGAGARWWIYTGTDWVLWWWRRESRRLARQYPWSRTLAI